MIKTTRVLISQNATETRHRPEDAEGRVTEEQWRALNPGRYGAQGEPSPPEPAKGMNGPTGNKGSPGIVGVPTWGCDPGSGEIWITGDNTIAREAGESQSYVSPDGAALSRAPEIPVTEVRPAAEFNDHPLHWVRRKDGAFLVWHWLPAEAGRWLYVDPLVEGDVNGYSGMPGFGTAAQDAFNEGWRYIGPVIYRVEDAAFERCRELLRCEKNARYNAEGRVKELEAGVPAIDTSALLARAEAAELARDDAWAENQEWCEINKSVAGMRDDWKNRALAAETRLAERNAPLRLLATRNPPR